jgi:hypothetical protein
VFGLVAQRLQQMGAAPLPQPQILDPAHIPIGDTGEITDHQGANPLAHGEGDDLLCSLMVGLVNAAAVAGLHLAQLCSVAAPTPRTALPQLGRSMTCLGLAGLLVAQVQIALGADRPPRDQQPGVLARDRVWVDDAKVDPGYPIRI